MVQSGVIRSNQMPHLLLPSLPVIFQPLPASSSEGDMVQTPSGRTRLSESVRPSSACRSRANLDLPPLFPFVQYCCCGVQILSDINLTTYLACCILRPSTSTCTGHTCHSCPCLWKMTAATTRSPGSSQSSSPDERSSTGLYPLGHSHYARTNMRATRHDAVLPGLGAWHTVKVSQILMYSSNSVTRCDPSGRGN